MRFLVFCAIFVALFLSGSAVARILSSKQMMAPGDQLNVILQITSAAISYVVVAMVFEGRGRPYELSPRRIRGLGYGLLYGTVSITGCCAAIALLGGYSWSLPAGTDVVGLANFAFAAGIGAGVVEELIFRGIIFRLFEEGIGTWAALLISGLGFGLVHITNPGATIWSGIAIALEAGMLLGIVYALTRSLWVVFGYHAAWNLVQGAVLGIPVSGMREQPSILHITVQGPEWLTGGDFGAENSVLTVCLMATVSVVLGIVLVRRNGVVSPSWSSRRRRAAAVPAPVD